MIASYASDPLRRQLRALRELTPFAPRSVEEALSRISGGRLLAPLRREIQSMRAQAARHGARPPWETACPFPAVALGAAVPGAIFHALALPHRPLAACPIEDAFPEEAGMRWLLRELGSSSLSLLPNPMLSASRLLPLEGASAGGAFAVASEAVLRQERVPGDVVVSAALDASPEGDLVLRSVSHLQEKIRLLEVERPGCRFFFVAPQGTTPTSRTVRLHPVEEGDPERLFRQIFSRRRVPEATALHRGIREAELAFRDQDYPTAKQRWTRILATLEATSRWRPLALSRLGAIELHAGDPEGAEEAFRLSMEGEGQAALSSLEIDELRCNVAAVHVDRLAPAEAASLLVPLLEGWRSRMAADPDGEDRRRVFLSCLGGMRRLHLLLGEAERACEVQRELLRWSPETERARSLGDLGECLRRAGRQGEAEDAFRAARAALDAVHLPTYRLQTEAFLAFYEGRLRLDTGRSVDRDALAPLAARLPHRSAAVWRLEQLRALASLREGDVEGERALLEEAERAGPGFLRWQAVLGLLAGGFLQTSSSKLFVAAAAHLEGLGSMCGGHPALDDARRRFVAAAQSRGDLPPLARGILRFSPN